MHDALLALKIMRLLLTLFALAMSVTFAQASETARFESLAREHFADPLERLGVAGAAVAAAEPGEPPRTAAFGYADPRTKTTIDPKVTAFHVASVTKLITAIAVLQLAEQGRINLDADARTYLWTVLRPRQGDRAVTMRDLLTHSSGLDIDYLNLAVTNPDKRVPLQDYLSHHMPPFIASPGERANYSNHGFGLLGLAIENTCKCRFENYVQSNILDRAGLRHAAMNAHPRARNLARATGFFYRDTIIEEPQIFEHMSAAGGALMSVADLASLVTALHERKLLADSWARELTSPQFSHMTKLGGGYGFGFWRVPGYAIEAWMVGGDIPGQSTRVLYLPQSGFVAVIAVNRKDAEPAHALIKEFLKPWRTQPAPLMAASTKPFAAQEPDRSFRLASYPRTNFLKIAGLFAPAMHVRPAPSGLMIMPPGEDSHTLWRSIGEGVYQREHTPDTIGFKRLNNGEIWAFMDSLEAGPLAFEPVPASEVWLPPVAGLLVPVALSVFALVGLMVTRVWRPDALPAGAAFAGLAHFTLAGFALAFAFSFYDLAIARDDRFAYEPLPALMQWTLLLPFAGAILSAVALVRSLHARAWIMSAIVLSHALFWFEVWRWRLHA